MIIIIIAFILLSTITATASTNVYTNEAEFQAVVGSFTVHNFDSFELNQGPDNLGFYLILDTQIPGIHFNNARVNLGSFQGTSKSSPNVVLNADKINPIVINFDQLQYGVGLSNTSLLDAERVEAFDINNTLIGSIDLSDHHIISFGGFISDDGISKVEITPIPITNGTIFIDDLLVSSFPSQNSGIDVTINVSGYRINHPEAPSSQSMLYRRV